MEVSQSDVINSWVLIFHYCLAGLGVKWLNWEHIWYPPLTLSWRRPLSYRNQPIDLLCKSMNWFLYDNGLCHERVNVMHHLFRWWFYFNILVFYWYLQNQPPEVFCKKGVLRIFSKFTGKHLCQSPFFNKVAALRPATLLKKRPWHRCFPVNFAKLLRTLFLQNSSRRLFLYFLVYFKLILVNCS